METLMGITSRDYVLLATDTSKLQSIMVMHDHQNKMFNVSDKCVMAVSGEPGDCVQFPEFIQKNVILYKIRNGYELTASEIAHYTRRNLAECLRSKEPYAVNTLMAGFDENEGAQLYFLDYLASLVRLPFAIHGYGGYFALSIMDRYHHDNLTVEEGYGILKKCAAEIQKRLILNQPNFAVKLVDKNGIKDLEPLTLKNLLNEASS